MAVQIAQSMNKARKDPLRYQAGPMSGRPQDPTLEQQAMGIAKQKAMAKGEEVAMPMLENVFGNIKTAFTGPAVSSAQATGIADIAAKTGTLSPGAANAVLGTGTPLAAKAAGTTGLTAGTTAATGATGSGMMAGLSAFAPYLIGGYFGGKALGLFNKGGYVNGPLAKVRYKQSGGPVNEEIEVSYGGPLSKGV